MVWKTFLKALLVIIILYLGLNYEFLWRNVSFYLKPPQQENFSPAGITDTPNRLVIPSLGVEAPIVFVEETDEAVFQDALQEGIVHYPGTASVGEFGNAYIFGHSSDYVWSKGDYKTIFALLPQLGIDDEIIATDNSGQKFKYSIIETRVVGPDDTSVLDQENRERKLLSLQTSYPIGTALRRFIVIAELVEN